MTGGPTPASTTTSRWVTGGVVLLVLAVAIGVALATPRSQGRGFLDPDGTRPEGARALTQVLRQQGVQVRPVTSSRAAVTDVAGSTLLVHRSLLLGPAQLERLADARPARLVLVTPEPEALQRLAPAVQVAAPTPEVDDAAPACALPDALAVGEAAGGGVRYAAAPGAEGVTACYPGDDADDQPDHSPGGSLVRATTPDGVEVIVLGRGDLLINDLVGQDGNAALAMRLLGSQPELIWYTADPFELAPQDRSPSLGQLLPGWLPWVIAHLVLVVLAAMLWRGRRFGPLVPEPLPVVVRAAETQEGRARLYRQARARGPASAVLRAAAARRLARHLSADAATSGRQLVSMVAKTTGQAEPAVHATLLGPAPVTDGDLVRLADELDTLERELRTRPEGP